jgi:hypothetical protein
VRLRAIKRGPEYSGFPLENLQLTVERLSNGKWRTIGQAAVERGDDGGCDAAELHASDFDGDGQMEMAVDVEVHAASRTPGTVYVFRWDGRSIRRLGSLFGDEGAEAGDLNRDGKWEARVWNDRGQGCHALMAAWPDHYAVRETRLVQVNDAFPSTYGKTRQDILNLLGRAPLDNDLWVVYQRALKLARIKESPRDAYDAVAQLAKKHAKEEPEFYGGEEGDMAIAYLALAARDNDSFPTSFDDPSDYPDPYSRP